MSSVDVTVSGLAELKLKVRELEGKVDLSEIVEDVGAVLLNRIKTRFLRQEAPDGGTWPESEAARRRAITGRDGGTLFDTGRLFHSIQLYRDAGARVRIGTDVPYAVYQQGPKASVERTFLGFSADDVDLAGKIAQRRIEELLRA